HGRNTFGNQISAVFCPLPVGEPNAAERLRKVRESMKVVKDSGQAGGAQALTRLGEFAPPTILTQAARLQAVARFFTLVVPILPGRRVPDPWRLPRGHALIYGAAPWRPRRLVARLRWTTRRSRRPSATTKRTRPSTSKS